MPDPLGTALRIAARAEQIDEPRHTGESVTRLSVGVRRGEMVDDDTCVRPGEPRGSEEVPGLVGAHGMTQKGRHGTVVFGLPHIWVPFTRSSHH